MSKDTRGPRPGRVPPHLQEEVDARRERQRRRELLGPWYLRSPAVGVAAAVLGIIVGVIVGRATVADPVAAAADQASPLLADLQQAGVIWESGAPGVAPVRAGRDALEQGDAAPVTAGLPAWKDTYERLRSSVETAAVPPPADGVRRLAVDTLGDYLAALESLGAAAAVEGEARELMLAESDRQLAEAQRTAVVAIELYQALSGDESVIPEAPPTAPTLPQPEADAPGTAPNGEGQSPQPTATTDATATPTPAEGSP